MAGIVSRIRYYIYDLKGSVIVDHLAENVIKEYKPLKFDFLDEDVMALAKNSEDEKSNDKWKMYFDRVVNQLGNRIGAVIISLKGKQFPIVIKLRFDCTNSSLEYKAFVNGL